MTGHSAASAVTAADAQGAKVTYVTLSSESDELHTALDAAISATRARLGGSYPLFIAGQPRTTGTAIESYSPADASVLVGRVAAASVSDVTDAIAAAKAAFPAWRATPWQTRAQVLQRAAGLVRARRFELAAWAIFEMGKTRMEALGEVEELADLIDYYVAQMQANQGYQHRMAQLSPADDNTSILRPYGVWAVIAPWNFPYALLGAPIAAALLTGNTVVAKPSSETPVTGAELAALFAEAGLPAGVFNFVAGSGRVVGETLTQHPDVAGMTFTGSYEVGFSNLFQRFSVRYPRPCIAEMGGKNAALVMDSADLERAVAGITRSAFGMNGHKCSACSRVYVHEAVAGPLLERLCGQAATLRVGDPASRGPFTGPLATRASLDDYVRFATHARELGVLRAGGETLASDPDLARGFFVRPTVIADVPENDQLMRTELFVPILAVNVVRSLDEALERANDTPLGLTAGFYSQRQAEIDAFLERIEAGVVYVNRAAGATTGAWPGVQPFGGWKGSGSTGKNIGGLYTLPCYLREQSRTVTT